LINNVLPVLWNRPLACAFRLAVIALLCLCALTAEEHKGQVKFNGLRVPAATVTATQGDRTLSVSVVADENGNYFFPDLPDGMWTFETEMLGFARAKQDVTVEGTADIPAFDLKMLSLDEINAVTAPPASRLSVTQNGNDESVGQHGSCVQTFSGSRERELDKNPYKRDTLSQYQFSEGRSK
jgi:hypothetical protein